MNTAGIRPDESMTRWAHARRMPVSIVIPSYNDVPLLTACLGSIEETCGFTDYEVIVVDDFCQPENSLLLRGLETDRVRVIFKERRQGFAVSVNLGMAEAKHDIVLLNSDIVAKPGWLEALQFSAHEVDPRVGIVSPKLVYPNGLVQYGGSYYARVLAPQWFGHLYVGSAATRPLANVAGYNRSISGACAYITRGTWDTLGGLDENFWLGFEDVDYGLRAWQAGIRCYYQPASMLVHHESASRGYSQGSKELASMRYFWRRWGDRFLTRALPGVPAIDLLVSDRSSTLWRAYLADLAGRLTLLGHDTEMIEVRESVDEAIVESLRRRESISLACDWGAATTAWLSTIDSGVPVYLLPTVESGDFPTDPVRQMKIVAGYRPEFDFIAPNRWTADQLRAETAWEARHRVVPALRPSALPPEAASSGVVTLGLAPAERRSVDTLASAMGSSTCHLDDSEVTPDVLESLRSLHPRAVVCLTDFASSLAPLALMSLGGVLIGLRPDKTRYEVLDGYNALCVGGVDSEEFVTALTSTLSDASTFGELRGNGHASAERAWSVAARETSAALHSIARVAV